VRMLPSLSTTQKTALIITTIMFGIFVYRTRNKKPKEVMPFHPNYNYRCLSNDFFSDVSMKEKQDIKEMGLQRGKTWNNFASYVNNLIKTEEHDHKKLKILYFVRHGYGTHNEAEDKFGSQHWEDVEAKKDIYEDAKLTERGIREAQSLGLSVQKSLQNGFNLELVISSPLSRALDTATIVFNGLNVPFISVENVRETIGKNTCDRRRSLRSLRHDYPKIRFDDSLFNFDEHDTLWTNTRESDQLISLRVQKFLDWLFTTRDERYIAIVGHNGWIRRALMTCGYPAYGPNNAEMVPVIVLAEPHH